jgi:hypothetical protein
MLRKLVVGNEPARRTSACLTAPGRAVVESLLIWLSGARQDVLALCETDRPKYAGTGSAILLTATMACVSMTFALHSALKLALAPAIVFAVAWGLAILNLDRWLVVSLVRQKNKLNYLLLALPRVGLGVLFGLVISTPFILQIFQPEITQELQHMQVRNSDSYYQHQATDPLAKKIDNLQSKVSEDNLIIGSGGSVNLVQDPHLTGELSQAENEEASDYKEWKCQLYGGAGCPRAGFGILATTAEQAYVTDKQRVATLQEQLSADDKSEEANNALVARQDLPADTAALKDDQDQQAQLDEAFTSTNASNAGLLRRLQALDEYAAGSSTLEAARWLLFGFFTAIECLPILVKVLLLLGPENTYEKALARADQVSLQLADRMLPEIVQRTTAARMRAIRAKPPKRGSWELVDVNHNGRTSQDGLTPTRPPPYRPPAL